MKKIVFLVIMLIVISISISWCFSSWYFSFYYKGVLKGYIGKEEYFDENGFQDYTDYCKYYYEESNNLFPKSDIYSEVKKEDIENIRSYFINFKSWMDSADRDDEYDFDDSCISEWDYFYIQTKEGNPIGDSTYEKFDNYSMYFYDTESATLFYIHSNI